MLPAGSWYRLSSGEQLQGPQEITVAAPANDLPVFVKSGAIIPMQTPVEYTSQPSDGILQVHIWYGKDNSKYTYYEDDGATFDYEKGSFYKREINWNAALKTIVLHSREGSFTTKFKLLKLVLHGFALQRGNIQINGKKLVLVSNADGTKEAVFPNSDKQVTIIINGLK